jgi:uncharacterized protein (DUF1330 family)
VIELPDGALDHFLAEDPGGPVTMLNLLRFRPDGGRERYAQYVAQVQRLSAAQGLEVVFVGDGDTPLAAEAGQAWDAVVLVRYPSRQAFAAMVRDPGYRSVEHLRSEALVEAVLQPTVAVGP